MNTINFLCSSIHGISNVMDQRYDTSGSPLSDVISVDCNFYWDTSPLENLEKSHWPFFSVWVFSLKMTNDLGRFHGFAVQNHSVSFVAFVLSAQNKPVLHLWRAKLLSSHFELFFHYVALGYVFPTLQIPTKYTVCSCLGMQVWGCQESGRIMKHKENTDWLQHVINRQGEWACWNISWRI